MTRPGPHLIDKPTERIADWSGLTPASEAEGCRAYLVARQCGLTHDLRGWDRVTTEQGGYSFGFPSLDDDEKMRWRLVAAAVLA